MSPFGGRDDCESLDRQPSTVLIGFDSDTCDTEVMNRENCRRGFVSRRDLELIDWNVSRDV